MPRERKCPLCPFKFENLYGHLESCLKRDYEGLLRFVQGSTSKPKKRLTRRSLLAHSKRFQSDREYACSAKKCARKGLKELLAFHNIINEVLTSDNGNKQMQKKKRKNPEESTVAPIVLSQAKIRQTPERLFQEKKARKAADEIIETISALQNQHVMVRNMWGTDYFDENYFSDDPGFQNDLNRVLVRMSTYEALGWKFVAAKDLSLSNLVDSFESLKLKELDAVALDPVWDEYDPDTNDPDDLLDGSEWRRELGMPGSSTAETNRRLQLALSHSEVLAEQTMLMLNIDSVSNKVLAYHLLEIAVYVESNLFTIDRREHDSDRKSFLKIAAAIAKKIFGIELVDSNRGGVVRDLLFCMENAFMDLEISTRCPSERFKKFCDEFLGNVRKFREMKDDYPQFRPPPNTEELDAASIVTVDKEVTLRNKLESYMSELEALQTLDGLQSRQSEIKELRVLLHQFDSPHGSD